MLTDFGVAKVLEEARTGLTTSNATALSIVCSSPEAVQGEERNVKSDVYSFACLVLGASIRSRTRCRSHSLITEEVMTGKLPFYEMGKNTVKIVTAKIKGTMPDPKKFPEISEEDPLWAVLYKCWAKEPDSRPTMPEILQEVSRASPMPSNASLLTTHPGSLIISATRRKRTARVGSGAPLSVIYDIAFD